MEGREGYAGKVGGTVVGRNLQGSGSDTTYLLVISLVVNTANGDTE